MAALGDQLKKHRTRDCFTCGETFTYAYSTGTPRKHCSKACYNVNKARCAEARLSKLPECSVDGCSNKATRVGDGVCEMHYYRLRRNGNYKPREKRYRYITGAGYIKLKIDDHPLSDSSGNIFEHRKVMYDIIGDKPKQCYWCDIRLEWDTLVIDHLNELKSDNRPDNLVISCSNCNRARGALLPFVARMREDSFDKFIECMREHRIREKANIKSVSG